MSRPYGKGRIIMFILYFNEILQYDWPIEGGLFDLYTCKFYLYTCKISLIHL